MKTKKVMAAILALLLAAGARTVRAAGDSYAYGLRQRRTDERTKEDKSGAQ